MDQNNGLEAKISQEESRTLLTIDLGEVPLLLTKVSLPDHFSRMGTTIQVMEDHRIIAQISHSIEAMEIDLKMDLPIFKPGSGETMESFPVLHRLKAETSHKITLTANQAQINPKTCLSQI